MEISKQIMSKFSSMYIDWLYSISIFFFPNYCNVDGYCDVWLINIIVYLHDFTLWCWRQLSQSGVIGKKKLKKMLVVGAENREEDMIKSNAFA